MALQLLTHARARGSGESTRMVDITHLISLTRGFVKLDKGAVLGRIVQILFKVASTHKIQTYRGTSFQYPNQYLINIINKKQTLDWKNYSVLRVRLLPPWMKHSTCDCKNSMAGDHCTLHGSRISCLLTQNMTSNSKFVLDMKIPVKFRPSP
ncbi:hypothetical protein FPOAC2_03258 [Fusarium poae]